LISFGIFGASMAQNWKYMHRKNERFVLFQLSI